MASLDVVQERPNRATLLRLFMTNSLVQSVVAAGQVAVVQVNTTCVVAGVAGGVAQEKACAAGAIGP